MCFLSVETLLIWMCRCDRILWKTTIRKETIFAEESISSGPQTRLGTRRVSHFFANAFRSPPSRPPSRDSIIPSTACEALSEGQISGKPNFYSMRKSPVVKRVSTAPLSKMALFVELKLIL